MPAAEGLEFRETARSRNGPHKAQGAAATRASWVKLGDVAGRQHALLRASSGTLIRCFGGGVLRRERDRPAAARRPC